MANKMDLTFEPDYATLPGETLQETLAHFGMSQADLAQRTGKTKKHINEIIKGKTPISPETALEFERVLGVPASFWNNLEKNYHEALVRIEERKRLEGEIQWLENFPVRDLTKIGLLPQTRDKAETLSSLFSFYGVSSSSAWKNVWYGKTAVFRKSPVFEQSPESVSAWLRIGELKAHKIDCSPFDKNKFQGSLDKIREQLVRKPIEKSWPDLVAWCAQAGVAVVCVPELDKTHLSGATHWLSPQKAIIQLSFRYCSDDHFWFTFFHESGHILKHGKRHGFIDNESTKGFEEKEANKFAADFLIPAQELNGFIKNPWKNELAIKVFAEMLKLSPGIVVGRLQHEKLLPKDWFNGVKTKISKEIIKQLV